MARLARFLVVHFYYPGALVASLALAFALLAAGVPLGAIVALNGVLIGALCFGLERAVPETPHWRLDPQELRTDALHAVLTNTLPAAAFRLLFYALIVTASTRLEAGIGASLWPDQWPLLAQLPLALVVAEAVSYAIHRFLHESRLWPLHAVHHSSPRLYFLLVGRKHPIQAFFLYGARLGVLWLLGCTPEALMLYAVVTTTNGYGTRICPAHAERLHRGVGLPDGVRVDQSYWAHLKLPFVWERLQPGAEPERAAATLGWQIEDAR